MTRLERIERDIEALSPDEIHKLADWLAELREEMWDKQIEADARAGKLDKLAEQALADHRAGRTKPL